MHEERASFQSAERSFIASNWNHIRHAGLKRRGIEATWRFSRSSWSLQPKTYGPWDERRKRLVPFAVNPADEQLLKMMMDDPGISDDRSDRTAAASTVRGCVDGSVSPAHRSRRQRARNGQGHGVSSIEWQGTSTHVEGVSPCLPPMIPSEAVLLRRQRRLQERRPPAGPGGSPSHGGGTVARAVQTLTVEGVAFDGGRTFAGSGAYMESAVVYEEAVGEPSMNGKPLHLGPDGLYDGKSDVRGSLRGGGPAAAAGLEMHDETFGLLAGLAGGSGHPQGSVLTKRKTRSGVAVHRSSQQAVLAAVVKASPASPASESVAAVDGSQPGSGGSPSRSQYSGQFVPELTSYLTYDLLLSPPEVVLEHVEAAMRRVCTTYDATRHHGAKATKMLQALAGQSLLDGKGLQQRMDALAEAVRRVRRWLDAAPALVPELLAAAPEDMMLALQEAWQAKTAKSLQEVAECAVEELRRLVATGEHPAPALLPQQLEVLDLVVRVRAPGKLLLQLQLEVQEEDENTGRRRRQRRRQQQQQGPAGEVVVQAVQRRRQWLTSLLAAKWRGRVMRGIGVAATELEDVMLDAFRSGDLSRTSLELRLKIIADAKTEAVAAAAAGPAAALNEGGEATAAEGEEDADGDHNGNDVGSSRGGRSEYTGRVAYVTTWLMLQPPTVVRRAVAEAVAGRGAAVLRFHRRWIKETARRAHGPGLLSDTQLEDLVRTVDTLTTENVVSFLEGKANVVETAVGSGSSSSSAAAVRGVATAYLTQELLSLPPADLRAALLSEWRGRTRDSVRYHTNVALRRIADLYSLRGGAVAGAEADAAAAAAAAASNAVQDATKEAIRLYALARQERLTGVVAMAVTVRAAAANLRTTVEAEATEAEQVANAGTSSGNDVSESELEQAVQRMAAATTGGLGAGLEAMEASVRAAVLGLLPHLRTDDLPPALTDPVVQHALRNDLDEITRTIQLADYIRPMGQTARSRLLLSVRRKLGRVAAAGTLAPESVAVAETVLRNAVVVLQLHANELLMLLLTTPPQHAGAAVAETAGPSLDDADTQVVNVLIQGWVGLPLSHKNSQVQGLRRNLRRALEVGLADSTSLRRAEELLRRASLQSYLVRNGYEAEAAAMAAAAGAAAAEEAKKAAEAVELPDAEFWRRAVAEGDWGVDQLVEQWRPLGPMARKRLKRRILHSLDRMAESGDIDDATAQSSVAVMRNATLALAREWRDVVQKTASASGADVKGSNLEHGHAGEGMSAFYEALALGDARDWEAVSATGAVEGPGWDSEYAEEVYGSDGEEDEDEELRRALDAAEDDSGESAGAGSTRRAARRTSPFFLRAAELAVLPPNALYERLMSELAATDYMSRKRLLERTREQVRARFDSGGLSASALRKMLTSIAAASNAVGRAKMRAAAQRSRAGSAAVTTTGPAAVLDCEGDSDENAEGHGKAAGASGKGGNRDGSSRAGQGRRTTTYVLTPEQEAALPRAWAAIRTESLLQPPDELRADLEAAWIAIDAHSHRNHHHYGRERLRQLRDSGLLTPEDYAARMVAMAAAARRARLARGEVIAKPRGRFTTLSLLASVSSTSDDGAASNAESLSPLVVELHRVRTALLNEYDADPEAFKAASKAVRLGIKMAVGRNRSPSLILPLLLPAGGGGGGVAAAALPPPPEELGREPWLQSAFSVSPEHAFRVWATAQWRSYTNALKDNVEHLRILLSGASSGGTAGGEARGSGSTAATTATPLSSLNQQRLAAGEAELKLWYAQATLLRSQLHLLAMSKGRAERGKAAAARAVATGAGDVDSAGAGGDGFVVGMCRPKIPRLGAAQQALFVKALHGRLAAAGVDLTEPEVVPCEFKSVYGRPPTALEQQVIAAANAPREDQTSGREGSGRSTNRRPAIVTVDGISAGAVPTSEELVAAGRRAEAAMDERTEKRLAILLDEQPTIFQLLQSPVTLRQTVVDFFKASGGEKSMGQKQLAAHRLRRRLDQLRSWGIIGPKRHVTQLTILQQVSSAWPHLLRGARLDEQGQLVAGLDGEDEVNRALGTMAPLQLQLWLMNRWRSMTDLERRMDTNVVRWRLRRLLDRGLISTDAFDAQRDAVGVLSARWRQIAEEGLRLDVANQMSRRYGRSGSGRPRSSKSSAAAANGDSPEDDEAARGPVTASSGRAAGAYDWLRRPRRSREEVAAERATGSTKAKATRGRPRGRPGARAANSRAADEGIEAAYYSIYELENGDLDSNLRALISSDRQTAAGGTGRKLSQGRWSSRATIRETAASGADGTVIDIEATAEVATLAPPSPTDAAAELPLDLLMKVARLQQLVRLQRTNLSELQVQFQLRLQSQSQSQFAANGTARGQQQQDEAGTAGAPTSAAATTASTNGNIEAQLAMARTVVQQAEERLAEWQQLLPPAALQQLQELTKLTATGSELLRASGAVAAIGTVVETVAASDSSVSGYEDGGNGTHCVGHSENGFSNGNGAGVAYERVENDGGANTVAYNECNASTPSIVEGVEATGFGASQGEVDDKQPTGATNVSEAEPLSWMEGARRRVESKIMTERASVDALRVGTASVWNGNGRQHEGSVMAAPIAMAMATAREFPTSYPLQRLASLEHGGDNFAGESDTRNGIGISQGASSDVIGVTDKGSVGAEADVVVDVEALKNKFFASALPPTLLKKCYASEGRSQSGGSGSQARRSVGRKHSRRVRK